MTADAENHSAIAATWQTAMIETEAAFDISARLRMMRTESDLRQRDPLLPLILAAAVLVRCVAHLVGFEEDHLRNALVGIDLRRQRRRIREFERHVAFPFGLEGSYVYDNSATCIGRFSKAQDQHIARHPKEF